jgi:adenylate cyclase
MKPPRFRYSISTILVFGFGGLMALAVTTVLYLGIVAGGGNTRTLLTRIAEAEVDAIETSIDGLLDPIEIQAAWIAEQITDGKINLGDRREVERVLSGALSAMPRVTGIVLLTPDGRFHRYVRKLKRMIVGDWRVRPLAVAAMAEARKMTGSQWGDIIQGELVPEPLINLRTTLRQDQTFVGGMAQVVSLSDLSRLLLARAGDLELTPFILYDRDWVLAHPSLIGKQTAPGADPLPRLESLDDPVLREIWLGEKTPVRSLKNEGRFDAHAHKIGDAWYVYVYRSFVRYGQRPWTIGIHFNTESQDDEVRRLLSAGLAGAIVLIVSVVVAVVIGRRTSRPIRRLAAAANRVQSGDLDGLDALPRSRVREFDAAAGSFNAMVEGLRERELIRDVFGRYVPERIAQALLSGDGELTPEAAEATVLFADIEGFTALTAKIGPAATVALLNAYFSAMVEILERHDGVVTQFQGDAILATFNVPATNPRHAANAIDAAREMLGATKNSRFAGHRVAIRIGIAAGEVVAGAVGAAGRLNYTVHGDTVNLAARLEQLNKEYATRLMVSQGVVDRAPDYAFRRIDESPVRGRAGTETVYTLDEEGA